LLNLKAALIEVTKAAEQTKSMQAEAGPAAYIEQEKLEKAQVSDRTCGRCEDLGGIVVSVVSLELFVYKIHPYFRLNLQVVSE
jgi:hypothetical protein